MTKKEIQDKIKATLARLTGGGKKKGVKHRKDKRQAASDQADIAAEIEAAEKRVLKLTEFVTVSELASMMDIGVNDIIGACMSLGMFVSINQRLDAEIIEVVAEEFNHEVGDINSVRVLPRTNAEIRKLAKSRNPFNHMAIMFKKTEVLLAGGYMHLHYLEDYYLWLRLLANQNKAQNLPNILVSARIGNGMHERRRGFSYLKSEYQLLKIKKSLNITGYLDGLYFFCLRGVSRLLPTNLLRITYKLLRN